MNKRKNMENDVDSDAIVIVDRANTNDSTNTAFNNE